MGDRAFVARKAAALKRQREAKERQENRQNEKDDDDDSDDEASATTPDVIKKVSIANNKNCTIKINININVNKKAKPEPATVVGQSVAGPSNIDDADDVSSSEDDDEESSASDTADQVVDESACGACSEEKDESAAHLFPEDERVKTREVKCNRSVGTRSILVSEACADGTLMGGCSKCVTSSRLPMAEFAPKECLRNGRKRPNFFRAVADFEAACKARDLDAAREARARVEKFRIGLCPPCVTKAKLTPAQQACKDFWDQIRKEMCALNDGCCNPDCCERGPQAWSALEGDHQHTSDEIDEALRKLHRLSDYKWWAAHGGVPAMQREIAKGMNWPCRFCHCLEKTSSQANKYTKADMNIPGAKRTGTKEEVALYKRQQTARIVYPKQRYVDRIKRKERKCCALCGRKVRKGQEQAFTFDHIDQDTKMKGMDTLAGEKGGVAGLVANHTVAATLDKIKPIIKKEIKKCRLLCANCDTRQTHGYKPRDDVVAPA